MPRSVTVLLYIRDCFLCRYIAESNRFDLIGAQSARVGEVSLFGRAIPQSYFNGASLCASSIPGRHGHSLVVCGNRNPLYRQTRVEWIFIPNEWWSISERLFLPKETKTKRYCPLSWPPLSYAFNCLLRANLGLMELRVLDPAIEGRGTSPQQPWIRGPETLSSGYYRRSWQDDTNFPFLFPWNTRRLTRMIHVCVFSISTYSRRSICRVRSTPRLTVKISRMAVVASFVALCSIVAILMPFFHTPTIAWLGRSDTNSVSLGVLWFSPS